MVKWCLCGVLRLLRRFFSTVEEFATLGIDMALRKDASKDCDFFGMCRFFAQWGSQIALKPGTNAGEIGGRLPSTGSARF